MKIKPACTKKTQHIVSKRRGMYKTTTRNNKQTKIKTKTNKTQNKQTSKLLLLLLLF